MRSTDCAPILQVIVAMTVVAISSLVSMPAQAACPDDACPLDAPLCIGGECKACSPNEFRCLGPIFGNSTLLQCNADGNGGQVTANCLDSIGQFCFEGANICAGGIPSCFPGSLRGCSGTSLNSKFRQCNVIGNDVDLIDCGPGKVCAGGGGCVDRPFNLLEENPGPDDIYIRNIAVTEVPGSTTAMMTFPGGQFASNDLHLRVLDPNAVSYIVPTGVFGTGRSPDASAARHVSRDSVLTAWSTITGSAPNEVKEIYYRWLNPDGTGSTSETLIGEGYQPKVVALDALTGAVVWNRQVTGLPNRTYEAVGRYLCPACSTIPLSIGNIESSALDPQAAPHDNGFIVVYRTGGDTYAQCFDSLGQPKLVTPMQVAPTLSIVAGAPGQGAVVVWDGGNDAGVRARRIDTNCTPVGDVIDVDPNRSKRHVEMWPNGRFVVAYESSEADVFGINRPSIFTKQFSAEGELEETAQVTPVGFGAGEDLRVGTWGSDSSIVIWSESRNDGLFAERPCAADITWADQTVFEERERHATATATLGANLALDSANISVNAPTISLIGPVTIGGIFAAGNAGTCPPPGACVDCSPPVVNTFDTDDDGWTSFQNGGTPVSHLVAGGNPGGYIRIADVTTGWSYLQAPASYLVPDAYGGELSFDLLAVTGNSINFPFIYNVRVGLQGAGLTLINEAGLPNSAWMAYQFPLDETSGWRKFSDLSQDYSDTAPIPTPAEMMAVMANLTGLYIATDYTDGYLDNGQIDETALDNVTLSSFP